jgi:F0F1-type ATP synthase assembly protein I
VVDDRKGRRELYNGFGNAVALGFEIAVTPVLFALVGYLIDWIAGTVPLFTIIFGVVGLVGVAVHSYYSYEARMQELDKQGPWMRKPVRR